MGIDRDRVAKIAKRGFDAYNAQGPNPGKAHDGRPVPLWDEIEEGKKLQIHGKWIAATEAIAEQVIAETLRLLRAGLPPDEMECALREHFSANDAPAITYSGDSA